MNALPINLPRITPADDIADALSAFREAYDRKHWFMIGTLPALPAMSHDAAEQAKASAYDVYVGDYRPHARALYEATVEAVDAAFQVNRTKNQHPRVQVRRDLLARDGDECWFCGQQIPDADMTIEHVEPVSRGGSDDPENLRLCHQRCNRMLGDLPVSEKLALRDQVRAINADFSKDWEEQP